MKQVVWKYGLLAGVILAALMFLTIPFVDTIGDMGIVLGYTTMLIGFMMVFFGIRAYRDGEGGGKVTFGRAFLIGLAITAIGSLCYVGAWEVISKKFMPDFADKYSARIMAKARADGMPEAELAATQKKMEEFAESYKNPWFRVPMILLEPLPVGLILSLVASGMLRRRSSVSAN
jgi:Protein of unknown function (DUF4199)